MFGGRQENLMKPKPSDPLLGDCGPLVLAAGETKPNESLKAIPVARSGIAGGFDDSSDVRSNLCAILARV